MDRSLNMTAPSKAEGYALGLGKSAPPVGFNLLALKTEPTHRNDPYSSPAGSIAVPPDKNGDTMAPGTVQWGGRTIGLNHRTAAARFH